MAAYVHKPSNGLLTPAQRAKHAQELAATIEQANRKLRETLKESADLADTIRAAEAQNSHLREVLAEQNRLARYASRKHAAELALKYQHTQYGGRAGLEAAAAEIAEYNARKRTGKTTA
jgi:hypothetical protein